MAESERQTLAFQDEESRPSRFKSLEVRGDVMPKRNLLVIVQKRMRRNVGLPRRGICIRAVHHVFTHESETEETNDWDGTSHVRRTCVSPHRCMVGV